MPKTLDNSEMTQTMTKQASKQALFTSNSDEWETPSDLFMQLDKEFHFTLDPCCTEHNAKCKRYFTKHENGLMQSWNGETVFCNPPYSGIAEWVRKAYEESLNKGTTVVLLIPSRTDTRYFHDYILDHAEIRFIRGRLRFSGSKNRAPFPSLIAVYREVP